MTPALHDIRARIAAISLENIASIAGGHLADKTSIIPLWFGESDVPTPAFIGEAAAAAIRRGETYYTFQNGTPELRETLAEYHTRLSGRAVGSDRITATSGGMPAIQLGVQMVAGEDDNIIVIDPVWPNIGGFAQIAGAEVRSVRLDLAAEGWTLDLDKVRAACDSRTRLIFYASPGNPTGAMIPLDVQAGLLAFARQRGIWLMADEVYHRLVFGQECGPTILSIAEPEDRVLVINSFSKSWAMTGWRLGWLVHPPSLGPTLAMMVQYTSSGTTTFLQSAAATAVRDGEGFVRSMRDYCADGCRIVCDALETFPRVRMGPRPKAAMYVFFEIDGVSDSRAACREILSRTRVGVAPGVFFGPGSERFLRICFCRSPENLSEAMDRLETMLG
ncbi:MAG: pyridoxal phosphate-dependent aminotransferase [Sphingomonadaceae bacterium]|nr:pyridoxal phosphate-dependent aminotransferase [Sphingomonadaceae bacterium]